MGVKQKNLKTNKELSARIMAVQACYELLQNHKPLSQLTEEYLKRGMQMGFDDGDIVQPQGALFKRIIATLNERMADIEGILKANVTKTEQPEPENSAEIEGNAEAEEFEEANVTPDKEIEPLLKSIFLCGIAELLAHNDIDAPLIIDDYLDVTHVFYEKPQISFVNGVLDNVSKVLRA